MKSFCEKWEVPALHGNKIRSRKGEFGFLEKDEGKKAAFFSELDRLALDDRLIAHACMICRRGYRDRYLEKYPNGTRWEMSKTAFDISVERAAKLAMQDGRKLDMVYERIGEKEDRFLESYFAGLRTAGTGFCAENSKQYGKIFHEAAERRRTLNDDVRLAMEEMLRQSSARTGRSTASPRPTSPRFSTRWQRAPRHPGTERAGIVKAARGF